MEQASNSADKHFAAVTQQLICCRQADMEKAETIAQLQLQLVNRKVQGEQGMAFPLMLYDEQL